MIFITIPILFVIAYAFKLYYIAEMNVADGKRKVFYIKSYISALIIVAIGFGLETYANTYYFSWSSYLLVFLFYFIGCCMLLFVTLLLIHYILTRRKKDNRDTDA